MKFILALALLIFVAGPTVGPRGGPGHQTVYRAGEGGEGGGGAQRVPGFSAKYPNNPDVLYLQALVTKEGGDAVRIYQSIVDNFPKSEWADDALYQGLSVLLCARALPDGRAEDGATKKEYPSSNTSRRKGNPRPRDRAEEISTPPAAAQPARRPSRSRRQ